MLNVDVLPMAADRSKLAECAPMAISAGAQVPINVARCPANRGRATTMARNAAVSAMGAAMFWNAAPAKVRTVAEDWASRAPAAAPPNCAEK